MSAHVNIYGVSMYIMMNTVISHNISSSEFFFHGFILAFLGFSIFKFKFEKDDDDDDDDVCHVVDFGS